MAVCYVLLGQHLPRSIWVPGCVGNAIVIIYALAVPFSGHLDRNTDVPAFCLWAVYVVYCTIQLARQTGQKNIAIAFAVCFVVGGIFRVLSYRVLGMVYRSSHSQKRKPRDRFAMIYHGEFTICSHCVCCSGRCRVL